MDEPSSYNKTEILRGSLKISAKCGLFALAVIILSYICTISFYQSPALYGFISGSIIQFYFMVFFIQLLAGFFSGMLIFKKYGACSLENEMIRNYGGYGGVFTGLFILALPMALSSLRFFSGTLHFGTFVSAFLNFFPFVITGIIAGFAGSSYAVRVIGSGNISAVFPVGFLRRKVFSSFLILLLIIFVPVFFSLVLAHSYEPEVIRYADYDYSDLVIDFISPDGNDVSTIRVMNMTYGGPYLVLEMENGTFAVFCYEFTERGDLNTLTYVSRDGDVSEPVPFLRSHWPVSYATEITGTGFALSDGDKNVFIVGYDGSLHLHTSVPEDLKRYSYQVEMVYPGGDGIFLRWGRYCALMDLNGTFSDVKSYGESGYSERLYRMVTGGVMMSSEGGYLISVKDDDSGELKGVWLDDSLDFVREEVIGSSHASSVSVYSGTGGDDMVLTDDIIRYDDRPVSEFEKFFRFYNGESGCYEDVFVDYSSYPEVFEESESGYAIFTVEDHSSAGLRGLFMKRCSYDGICNDPVSVVTGYFADINIMQTSDGGYLCVHMPEPEGYR